jgi:hypothetical protein
LFNKVADGLRDAEALLLVGCAQTAQLDASIFNQFHSFPDALIELKFEIELKNCGK